MELERQVGDKGQRKVSYAHPHTHTRHLVQGHRLFPKICICHNIMSPAEQVCRYLDSRCEPVFSCRHNIFWKLLLLKYWEESRVVVFSLQIHPTATRECGQERKHFHENWGHFESLLRIKKSDSYFLPYITFPPWGCLAAQPFQYPPDSRTPYERLLRAGRL